MKHLKLLLVITLAAIPLMPIQAGHPAKCDPEQGAPCTMKSCAHLAKKQQWCSPKCHKDCCKCPTEGPQSCNGHNPERSQQPEEEQ